MVVVNVFEMKLKDQQKCIDNLLITVEEPQRRAAMDKPPRYGRDGVASSCMHEDYEDQ